MLIAIILASCTDPPPNSVGPLSRDESMAADQELNIRDTAPSGLDAASDAEAQDDGREREREWKFD